MAFADYQSARGEAKEASRRVFWLGATDPPSQLVAHLRSRGVTLEGPDPTAPMPSARLTLLEASASSAARAPTLAGRRIAVMHPDPGSADALAQALRARGAEVVVLSLNPESLHRAELLDPDAVLVEPADFYGSCWEIVRALWQHPRLRFATVMLFTPEAVGSDSANGPDTHNVAFAVHALGAEYERVRDQAREQGTVELELELLGPARMLRALLESGRSLRVHVAAPDLTLEVDLAESIIVGAQGGPGETVSQAFLGPHALALLLAQDRGHVRVRSVEFPAVTNIMAQLDTALFAAREAGTRPKPSGVRWAKVSDPQARAAYATPREGWTAPAVEPQRIAAIGLSPPLDAGSEPKLAPAASPLAPAHARTDDDPRPADLAQPAAQASDQGAERFRVAHPSPRRAAGPEPLRPAHPGAARAMSPEPTRPASAESAPVPSPEPARLAAKSSLQPARAPSQSGRTRSLEMQRAPDVAPPRALGVALPHAVSAEPSTVRETKGVGSEPAPVDTAEPPRAPSKLVSRAPEPPAAPADVRTVRPGPDSAPALAGRTLPGLPLSLAIGIHPDVQQPDPAPRAPSRTGSLPLIVRGESIAPAADAAPVVLEREPTPAAARRKVDLREKTLLGVQAPSPAASARSSMSASAAASRSEPAHSLAMSTAPTLMAIRAPSRGEAPAPPPPARSELVVSDLPDEEPVAQEAADTALHVRQSLPRARSRAGVGLVAACVIGLVAIGFTLDSRTLRRALGMAGPAPATSVVSRVSAVPPASVAPASPASPPRPAVAVPAPVAAGAPSALEPVRAPHTEGVDEEHGEQNDDEATAASEDSQPEASSRRARAARASRHVSVGHAYRKRGQLAQARAQYTSALNVYPGYPRALAGLAQLAITQGEGAQAVSYARALVRARPSQASYQLLLGDAYRSAGMLDKAQKAWQAALRAGSTAARERLKS